MGQKIVVGPIKKGLKNNVLPFNIDNDSFVNLINAYQWRDRIKRKRGSAYLSRLQRKPITLGSPGSTQGDGSFGTFIFTFFGLPAFSTLVPGKMVVTVGAQTFTEPNPPDGTLSNGTGGVGSVNYASGVVGIFTNPVIVGIPVFFTFQYYPNLPVMGLEEFVDATSAFPGTIAFDTTYSYNLLTSAPYQTYDVSYYKNPNADALTLPGYVRKNPTTPNIWTGQNYQQFWTVNYQGALWATNGIDIPFTGATIGMQFKPILTITNITVGPPAIVRLTLDVSAGVHHLIRGDFLFINEVNSAIATGINLQTGYVVSADPQNANFVDVEFPNATILNLPGAGGGIAQYLTNNSDFTKDGIRWYDGDPTDGDPNTLALTGTKGWVNFAPPLSQLNFSIAELPADRYYLVGARMILPFKDRLIFIGPVVQTSLGSPIYLQDTVIYSQNGTPYYTCSFTGDALSTATVFNEILVPRNQTATATAYFEDQIGYGGFVSSGIDQPINTASQNEDVIIMGFDTIQSRFVYTGNDVLPFLFYTVNSELGSSSTFSIVNMDKGVITRGSRGFVITDQTQAQRIDVEIPDEVFEMNLLNNGIERICAQRDFINEWIYFTYRNNNLSQVTLYPNQTLLYNYRDDSWGMFYETYTTYGVFRKKTGETWATIGTTYPTWQSWNDPWNAGASTLEQPRVIGGNSQGFVMLLDEGTAEGNSIYIKSFSTNTVTSNDHCLNEGDFIRIVGALGAVGSQVNNKTFFVSNVTQNTFDLNPPIVAGAYVGNGLIQRMYIPFIQSKQFPLAWDMGRKTRIGVQQYLLTKTDSSQIQLLIFLSQNGDDAYNDGPIYPSANSQNNSLIYSSVLYTCPESTNLGLTPANVNLQMPTAVQQKQIWHRINTSLLGDTVQVGFTMSDDQMTAVDADGNPTNAFAEVEIHGFILDCSPSSLLC